MGRISPSSVSSAERDDGGGAGAAVEDSGHGEHAVDDHTTRGRSAVSADGECSHSWVLRARSAPLRRLNIQFHRAYDCCAVECSQPDGGFFLSAVPCLL
jgi:hypothetical protein